MKVSKHPPDSYGSEWNTDCCVTYVFLYVVHTAETYIFLADWRT